MANIEFERERARRNQQMWDAREREREQLDRMKKFQDMLKNTTKRSERTALTSAFRSASQERSVAMQDYGATNRARMNNVGQMARMQWGAKFNRDNMTADQRERNRLASIRDRFTRNLEARKFNENRIKNDRFTYTVTNPDTGETTSKVGYYSQSDQNKHIQSLMQKLMSAKDMKKALDSFTQEDREIIAGYRAFMRGNMPIPELNGEGKKPTTKDVFHVGKDAEGNPVYYNTKAPQNEASQDESPQEKDISDTGANSDASKIVKKPVYRRPGPGYSDFIPSTATNIYTPNENIGSSFLNSVNWGGPSGNQSRAMKSQWGAFGAGVTLDSSGNAVRARANNATRRKKPKVYRNPLSHRLDQITYDALRGGFRNF